MPRNEVAAPESCVPHHQAVWLHRVSVWTVSKQGFALLQTRSLSLRFMVSASSREAAVKLIRVSRGVSKKASATVLPRKAASFFSGCFGFPERFAFDREESQFVRGERFKRKQVTNRCVTFSLNAVLTPSLS